MANMNSNDDALDMPVEANEDELGANRNVPRKPGSNEKCNPTLYVCCSREHSLEECPQLNKKHREKFNFLMEKGICFACLCTGHRRKNCDRRQTCKGVAKVIPPCFTSRRKELIQTRNSPRNRQAVVHYFPRKLVVIQGLERMNGSGQYCLSRCIHICHFIPGGKADVDKVQTVHLS